MKISREEFKKQLRARRIAKEASAGKFARLRLVAQKYPRHVSAAIIELANSFHEIGESLHTMNDNLGLASPPKTASLAVRAEAAKTYAANFQQVAEDSPEELSGAVNEVYSAINDLAGDLEAFAENSGIELVPPMADESIQDELAEGHESVEGPEFVQEELAEAGEAAAEGDMPEAAAEAHDAEEAAEVAPAEEAAPVEASVEVVAGTGSDAFVTDRDENGQPKAPKAAFLKKRRTARK